MTCYEFKGTKESWKTQTNRNEKECDRGVTNCYSIVYGKFFLFCHIENGFIYFKCVFIFIDDDKKLELGCTSKSQHSTFGNEKCKDDFDFFNIKGKTCIFDGDLSNGDVEVDHPQPEASTPTTTDEKEIDDKNQEDNQGTSDDQDNIVHNQVEEEPHIGGVERNLPHFSLLVMVAYFAM